MNALRAYMTRSPGEVLAARPATGRDGFTMIEILLAAMILAIGFIMLLPAFTIGLAESRQSMDNSIAMQVAQNAEAYCMALLNKDDHNWRKDNVENLTVYEFGLTSGIANHESIRIHGDPSRSRFYWNMLFRINPAQPNQVDLWIMVCKRDDVGGMNGIISPTTIGVSGAAGGREFSGNSNLEADTTVVADTGEILNIVMRNGDTVTLDRPITRDFGRVWMVRTSDGDADNGCIYVVHTKKSF